MNDLKTRAQSVPACRIVVGPLIVRWVAPSQLAASATGRSAKQSAPRGMRK